MIKQQHWTERSTEDFVQRITFDFTTQIEKALESSNSSQAELATKLRVTEGRVSQILNNPGNLGLKNIVKYARAIGRKVAIVLYDDGDSANRNGPVNSEIFSTCWERAGRPNDFFALDGQNTTGSVSSYGLTSTSTYYVNTQRISEHDARLGWMYRLGAPYDTPTVQTTATTGNPRSSIVQ